MNFWSLINENGMVQTDNTAYMLWAYALTFSDIASFGNNVVYTGNIR